MANPGAGTKFVSVNLNKSYGQSNSHHHSSYYGSNRTRPGSHGGGGSGGMVVLSRPRSSHKPGTKLAVPPPLNLPSLRKEHERFDSLGSSGGPAGGGVSGSGSRPSSSGVGWTKPGTAALQEKEGTVGDRPVDSIEQSLQSVDAVSRSNSMYMPPSARSGAGGPAVSASPQVYPSPIEKVSVLRGEDFPSLQAALPSTSGPPQKQKEGLTQKQKQVTSRDFPNGHGDGSHSSPLVDMRPQLQLSRQNVGNGLNEKGDHSSLTTSRALDNARKQEDYFPVPLPLVRLNPRSDWADDERETGHGLTDRGRDNGFSRSEAYWDTEFDMPRISVLPHKLANNIYDRRGQRDDKAGRVTSSEVPKVDPYMRDVKVPNREGQERNLWRDSPLSKDGFVSQEVGNDRDGVGARASSMIRDTSKENKYMPSTFREKAQENIGRRDVGYGQGGRQPWNNSMDSFSSRGPERNNRDRYGNDQFNRHRGDTFQNSSASKSSFSSGGKGLPVNDPILNFGREKRPFSKSEKPYLEDPFMATGFDGRDPFSGGIAGLVKKKKDVVKQTDFHDPVRESFEAELERVQKMQEQERQRIIEEQERALELARREEEERARMAREQEERQRRLEDEARKAAWRAEQEQLEATRKTEELRIAREEEKRRIFMEEERRKQAAKQKLIELEEKMAKRKAESANSGSNSSATADDKMSGVLSAKDVSRVVDMGDWEDSERMVERITTSAPYDSSSLNRPFDMDPRSHFPRDGSSTFVDRGNPVNSWRRDFFENRNSSSFFVQDQDSHHSPRLEASASGRSFTRKEFYGGPGFMPPRAQQKGGDPEMHTNDSAHLKGQRLNLSGVGDHYGRNSEFDSDFHENLAERFGDVGWGQGRLHDNPYSPYPEHAYQNSDADGVYSTGRSRYVGRQPRVLPPPSLASMHKNYRGETERPGPSNFVDVKMQYSHVSQSESILQTGYDSGYQGNHERSGMIDVQQTCFGTGVQNQDRSSTPRCDSQSSLCVSSPPSSPTHLSHDDLDESRESPVISAALETKDTLQSGNESAALPSKAGREDMVPASNSDSADDDEEWTVENDEHLQEPEEYDEDEDGYEEEDEVHKGDDVKIDLTHDFEDIHLEEKGSPQILENLVLGFNEGVEVVMPSDEFERSSRDEVSAFGKPQISSQEEQGPFDGVQGDGQGIQPVDAMPQISIDSSSRILQETEKKMQELVIQPNNDPKVSTTSELLDNVDASSSCGLPAQHPVTMTSPSSSSQTVMSTVPTVPSQSEVPVKLQFGLFSGPSLIPSPVPAIQIGSIQMPLHLHPQVGPSVAHMHPSQPPLFQFGQLRYTSPISQGVLPLGPQSMSFVHPNMSMNQYQGKMSMNQNQGSTLPIQPGRDISAHKLMKSNPLSGSMDSQLGLVTRPLELSQGTISKEVNSVPSRGSAENITMIPQGQSEISHNNMTSVSGGQLNSDGKFKPLSSSGVSESQPQTGAAPFLLASKDKDSNRAKVHRPVSGGRGKKYIFAVKDSGSRSSFPAADSSHLESGGFQRRHQRNVQRTEFRVRENFGLDDKSNINSRGTGIPGKNYSRKVIAVSKGSKQTSESSSYSSGPVYSREFSSGSRVEKGAGKEALTKSQNLQHFVEINHKRNIRPEEDVDVPLQSGVVRVFEQPGIEAPSDEDDFIEVRSKRQMLNDRREQREKENKAKSRMTKMSRKPRSTQSAIHPSNPNKISSLMGGEAAKNLCSEFVSTDRPGLGSTEASAGFNSSLISQPLAPIGTPAAKNESQTDIRSQPIMSLQPSPLPAVTGGGKKVGPGVILESKNKLLDKAQPSLGSWGNSRMNQQVMSLTQTQLDEAMIPAKFDSHASVGDHTISATEPSLPSSSIMTKDKSFSSAASPINSLLAGEKIQFGAVTSPTILPPSVRSVSQGIGPPGPCRQDIQISHNLSAAENDCSLFFDKEKRPNESCGHLNDCEAEAEAEAAASAVAVAAITSDDIGTCSVSVSDTKSFVGAEMDGMPTGVAGQSRAEESLSVALPADLSVEMQPISLWPPLPSPQNSPSQMLSHFPGGPPSHFPFYEMNPMLGGPIFAYGPHDESASNQSQSQKNNSNSVSGPLGTWQQCHSGVDSFYGPPAGFTGPFISPPGGIPGVQGPPPHMVVYNHFAPVGQFGQLGLSFMGATYIPSGKQSDWNKHNPTSSAMGVEGDMNNLNMASAQRNPTNMPPIQHLAPGSPLMPMASPLAMFDVSPFQSSPDMARWSHVPPSPTLHSVPLSMPLQQHVEAAHSQFMNHVTVEQSLPANRFPESRTSSSSEGGHSFHVTTNTSATQLPDELGLSSSSSASTIRDTGKIEPVENSGANINSGQNPSSGFKHKNVSSQQYSHNWSHHRSRMGFQGRNNNQSSGAEKNFPSAKMKQIYVAKQTTNGSSTASSGGV